MTAIALLLLPMGIALVRERGRWLVTGYKHLFKGYGALTGKDRAAFERRLCRFTRFTGRLLLLICCGLFLCGAEALLRGYGLFAAGVALALTGILFSVIYPAAGGTFPPAGSE